MAAPQNPARCSRRWPRAAKSSPSKDFPDRKSTRLNSSHTVIYTLSLHDALPIYCGACTVLLNGRTTKSCTLFAPMAEGGEIVTVEGLSKNGELHPVQQAFAECHG